MNHRRIEGDCLEVMRDLPRGHFDLLLTDPPYAMPGSYYKACNGGKVVRRWSDTSILTGWWGAVMARAFPCLKRDAMIAVFADSHALAAFYPVMYEASSRHLQVLVWDKGDAGLGHPFMIQTEFVVVGAKGIAYKQKGQGVGNILRCPRVPPLRKVHPAQKPVELLKIIARHLCPESGRVLDPFAGSFSTEAACDRLGLECTSIELGEAFAMPDEQGSLAI